MIESLTWHEETRKLTELKPYPKNPRRISKNRYQDLVRDIKERGYSDRVKVNLDNVMASGHQRYKALKECGFVEIPVLVPNRLLNQKEFEREVIASNLRYGEYDYEMLSNEFDAPELIDWGMDPADLVGSILEEEKVNADPDPAKIICDKCGK